MQDDNSNPIQQAEQQEQLDTTTPTTMEQPTPTKLKQAKKRKQQKNKHKNKMITGYIIYASEIRKEVIKKYPEKDFGDISKLVGIEWKNLPQGTKVSYEKRAQEQNNISKMLNEKAEAAHAALELMKLADTVAARDLEQSQQPEQRLAPSVPHQSQQFQPQQSYLSDSYSQQKIQQPVATMVQYCNGNCCFTSCRPYSGPGTATPSQSPTSYYQYSSQQQQPEQRLAPSAPPQPQFQQQQQQPYLSDSYSQQQIQQPVTTMVQYYNSNCCFTSCRPFPGPGTATPSQSPTSYYQYTPQPQHHQQQQQQEQLQQSLTSTPLQQFRRNNIIYRKPVVVRLRPKDASTQTDPVKWVERIKDEPKKPLKFSQKFIEYLKCNSNMSL